MPVAKPVFSALAFLALMLGIDAASAEPAKLRIGWVVPAADSPLLMFGKPGIARHEGTSYTLEAIHFNGTPPMITALSAGEIDLAPLAFSSFALAVENAKLDELRIIADVFQDGVEGHYTNEYMVLKDGPVTTIEDLKGRVVTSNGGGSAVDMALREMLRKHNLEEKRDYTLVEAAFPNMRAMLAEKKVDLISGVRPFTDNPDLRAIARTLFTQKDAIGPSQMIILTAWQGFIAKYRAAFVDYLEDSLRALQWYSDPAHHDEVVKIISDFTKTPPAVWNDWLFTKAGDYYKDPQGRPNLTALQSNIETQRELGFLKEDLDVRKYADLSLVDEAAKRLK